MPGSNVGIFFSGKLFHGIYGLFFFFVFQCPLSILYPELSSEEASEFCWQQFRGSPPIVSVLLYVVHRIFLISWHHIKWYKREVKRICADLVYLSLSYIFRDDFGLTTSGEDHQLCPCSYMRSQIAFFSSLSP